MALDPLADLRNRIKKLEIMLRSRYLERSSITDGVMTFIRGRLRLLQGAVLEIVGNVIGSGHFDWIGRVDLRGPVTISGTWRFTGDGAITGDVVAEGKWTQNGSWEFNGPGDIAGDVSVTGALDVDGPWSLDGDGDITGDVDLTGDLEVLGDGRIKVGDVIISPINSGRVTVGTGSRQIVIDAATQRIRVGTTNPMTIELDSNGNGIIEMSTGARVRSLPSANIELEMRSADDERRVVVGSSNVIAANGTKQVMVKPDGFTFVGLDSLPPGETAQYIAATTAGNIYRAAGIGGGGGEGTPGPVAGDFMWPFDPSTTHPVLGVYGMRLNPVTGEYKMHWGQDFTVAGGSPIPAIGDGTVVAVSSGDDRGNRIYIDHGGGVLSDYFHMNAPATLSVGASVSRGDTVGYVGTTGSSTGDHLHLEITQGGGRVDPAEFFAAQS